MREASVTTMDHQAEPLSPLTDVDNLDVIGERTGGGIDMVIATAGPLDGSDETCTRLHEKLNAYLCAALHPDFANMYPAASRGRVRIFVSDRNAISERARLLVEQFSLEALARNVEDRIGNPVQGDRPVRT